MEGAPRSAAVLANIQADRCVPDEAQRLFFASLEGRRFASAEEAWEAACKTVASCSSDLTLTGNVVTAPGFRTLLRMMDIYALAFCVEATMKRSGHTLATLEGLSPEEREEAINDILSSSPHFPVALGNPFGIVWATDAAEVNALLGTAPLEVYDRLGLDPLRPDEIRIICTYERSDVSGELHVPRCLDAIKLPYFVVTMDCSAATGMTKPVNAHGSGGFREIVHWRTVLPKAHFRVVRNVA